jgi:hypothetical protein
MPGTSPGKTEIEGTRAEMSTSAAAVIKHIA